MVSNMNPILKMKEDTYQNQNKPSSIASKIGWILDANDSKDVTYCLGKSRYDDDPGISLFIEDCLDDVADGGQREENREEICGADIGTEVPLRIVCSEIWEFRQI